MIQTADRIPAVRPPATGAPSGRRWPAALGRW